MDGNNRKSGIRHGRGDPTSQQTLEHQYVCMRMAINSTRIDYALDSYSSAQCLLYTTVWCTRRGTAAASQFAVRQRVRNPQHGCYRRVVEGTAV